MINLARIPEQFETDQLIAKRCDPGYADALFDAASESIAELHPFLPWCHPDYERSESAEWLEASRREWDSGAANGFLVFDKSQQRLLGGCGLNFLDNHPVANLGYWIRTSEMGKGYATEATVGLAHYAFRYLSIIRIEIIMSVDNPASRQVAINSGASLDALLRKRLLLHGEPHDAYLYSLVTEAGRFG